MEATSFIGLYTAPSVLMKKYKARFNVALDNEYM